MSDHGRDITLFLERKKGRVSEKIQKRWEIMKIF
jgi:hypothetical protein